MSKRIPFFIILLFLGTVTGCNTQDNSMNDVIFTGIDSRTCACCGGFMITFSNNPVPYQEPFNLTDSLPPNSGITVNTTFPAYAKINWKDAGGGCPGKIIVTGIVTK
jgi:hypothetical protein